MYLQILLEGPWKIVSPVDGEGDDMACGLLDALEKLKSTYEASVLGIYDLWRRIDHIGPRRLGNEIYRCVDEAKEIYEFRKGDLRVFSFTRDGAICVCSNVGVKHGRKVNKADINAAARFQKMVSDAAQDGTLRYVRLDKDGKPTFLTSKQLLKKS